MPGTYGFKRGFKQDGEPSFPWIKKTCPNCKKKFETRNSVKKFCKEKCRVTAWIAENGQSRAVRQYRHIIKEAERLHLKLD